MKLDSKTTAVIAVHLQKDIVAAAGAFGPFFAAEAKERDVLARGASLFAAARAAGALVVYLRVAWRADYTDMLPNSPLLGMVQEKRCLVDGTDGAAIVAEVAPQPGDLVITHQRPGGFTASQLEILLRARGIETVLFCGVATNASVEGTARQASDLGYRTIVVGDACSAANAEAHAASLGSLGLLAEIATHADVLAALQ